MAKTDKQPRLTTTDSGGCVELDGVRIRWRCSDGGKWSIQIEADDGMDMIDVHHEKATMATH